MKLSQEQTNALVQDIANGIIKSKSAVDFKSALIQLSAKHNVPLNLCVRLFEQLVDELAMSQLATVAHNFLLQPCLN